MCFFARSVIPVRKIIVKITQEAPKTGAGERHAFKTPVTRAETASIRASTGEP